MAPCLGVALLNKGLPGGPWEGPGRALGGPYLGPILRPLKGAWHVICPSEGPQIGAWIWGPGPWGWGLGPWAPAPSLLGRTLAPPGARGVHDEGLGHPIQRARA